MEDRCLIPPGPKAFQADMTTSPILQVRDLVLDYFPPERRRDRAIRTLANILTRFIHGADLGTRLDAYADLREWTSATPAGSDTTRLEMVLQLMEAQSELRIQFQREVRQILTEIRSVELFAEAGLHPREGMMSELWRRIVERILPSAREDTDLSKLIHRLYPTSEAIDRLIDLPDETFERIARLMAPVGDTNAWARQREDVTQAFYLLGVHVAGIGLSPAMRARSHATDIEVSPFYELQQTAIELVKQEGATPALDTWRERYRTVAPSWNMCIRGWKTQA